MKVWMMFDFKRNAGSSIFSSDAADDGTKCWVAKLRSVTSSLPLANMKQSLSQTWKTTARTYFYKGDFFQTS